MLNFNSEMMEKAKAAKSAEELLALAKENNVEMTAEEAKSCFEQINSKEIDDDLLDGVAGGIGVFAEPPINNVSEGNPNSKKSQCG